MKKIVLLLLPFMVSCSIKDKESAPPFPEDRFKEMSIDEHDEQFFLRGTDDSMYIATGGDLLNLYKIRYKKDYKNFREFWKIVVSGNITLDFRNLPDDHYYDYRFKLNQSIVNRYKAMGTLPNKYCKPEGDIIWFSQGLTFDEKFTVAYCFWMNGYEYVYACMTGTEYLAKRYKNVRNE